MRKSLIYVIFMMTGLALMGTLFFLYPHIVEDTRQNSLNANQRLVKKLRLTDLCLFTEARYTRHPSQADLHSAFQDHPLALEHFPSGSMLLPPQLISPRFYKE